MRERIEIVKGDITTQRVDAIVNAANSFLRGGGGVDGAIHRAGGSAILQACKKIIAKQGHCPIGEAVITTAGLLPAKYVIHTVGPVWRGGNDNEPEQLSNCYKHSLLLAVQYNVTTIAFPNISTGIYGYPKERAVNVAIDTVIDSLKTNGGIQQVRFVCFDDENYILYKSYIDSRKTQ